jgi:hypothetical protein
VLADGDGSDDAEARADGDGDRGGWLGGGPSDGERGADGEGDAAALGAGVVAPTQPASISATMTMPARAAPLAFTAAV